MNRYSEIYGIDIGNGYCSISLLNNDGKMKNMLPQSVYYKYEFGMPSTALVEPEDIYVNGSRGTAELRIKKEKKYAYKVDAVKTRMGLDDYLNDLPKDIKRKVSPYDVYAAITRDLVMTANEQRRLDGKTPIYHVSLAYPAFLCNKEGGIEILNKIIHAVEEIEIDGQHMEVVSNLPEPAAVATDFLYFMQHEAPETERIDSNECTVLVYDLGHGTFDVAVATARTVGVPHDVIITDGVPHVGGKYFTEALVREIKRRVKEEYDYTIPPGGEEESSFVENVIEAKHALSERDGDETVIEHFIPSCGKMVQISITRSQYEELVQELIDESIECAVMAAEKANTPIDYIVLSGGGSKMPAIRTALREVFPNTPIELFRPHHGVSFGAARYAVQHSAKLYTQFTYGIMPPDAPVGQKRCKWMVSERISLPAESEAQKIRFEVDGDDVRFFKKGKENEEPVNLAWMNFDVPVGEYTLKFTVGEDYNISASLQDSTGKTYTQDTKFKSADNE